MHFLCGVRWLENAKNVRRKAPQKSAQLPTVSQKETKYTASDFWCAFHFIPPCFACLLARCIHVAAGTKNLKSPSTDDFKFSHQ